VEGREWKGGKDGEREGDGCLPLFKFLTTPLPVTHDPVPLSQTMA